ncbi:hypothetical protein V5O48_007062, partial [Marasmius crinis-equi]
MYGIMLACATLPAYMLTFFLPLILAGMNFSTADSLLLWVTGMFFAWLSDKYKRRAVFIIIQAVIGLVGCCMTAFTQSHAVRYAGIYLICCAAQGNIPAVLAWGANNVLSHSKRSVQSAIAVAGGGVGGVLASTVFREQDSPNYIPGLWVTIGSQIILIIIASGLCLHYARANRLARTGRLPQPLEGREEFR